MYLVAYICRQLTVSLVTDMYKISVINITCIYTSTNMTDHALHVPTIYKYDSE